LRLEFRLRPGSVRRESRRNERTESFLDFFLRRGAHGAEGAPVKGILGGEDFVVLTLHPAGAGHAVKARQFEQSFVGLRAAVAEEHSAGTRITDQLAGQLSLPGGAEEIAGVRQAGGLSADCRHPGGVAVAQGVDGNSRGEIQIGLAGVIPDFRASAPGQGQSRSVIVLQDVSVILLRDIHSGGLGSSSRYAATMADGPLGLGPRAWTMWHPSC